MLGLRMHTFQNAAFIIVIAVSLGCCALMVNGPLLESLKLAKDEPQVAFKFA